MSEQTENQKRIEIIKQLQRLKHKEPNHQRGIGYNEGLDNALVVVKSILGNDIKHLPYPRKGQIGNED